MQFCFNGIRNCKAKLENHEEIEKKNLNADQCQNAKTGPLSIENSSNDDSTSHKKPSICTEIHSVSNKPNKSASMKEQCYLKFK